MSKIAPNSTVLSVPEFAKLSGACTETIRRHCRKGVYPGAYLWGNRWQIPRKCLPLHAQVSTGGVDPTADLPPPQEDDVLEGL